MIKCLFCSELVEQCDVTAGGADSEYSKGAAGEFDYPAQVECRCGAEYCDGDLVVLPSADLTAPIPYHHNRFRELLLHPIVLAALSKLVEHVDDT